jgi:anti-sigma regulatory factor (Ser/Thr protein kinase)
LGHTKDVRKLRLSVPDRPEYAQVLRHRLRAWLAEVGIDGDLGAEVVSACSEAFNNAVLHPIGCSDGVVEITGERIEGLLRLTVQDQGRWPPKARQDRYRRLRPTAHALTDGQG